MPERLYFPGIILTLPPLLLLQQLLLLTCLQQLLDAHQQTREKMRWKPSYVIDISNILTFL